MNGYMLVIALLSLITVYLFLDNRYLCRKIEKLSHRTVKWSETTEQERSEMIKRVCDKVMKDYREKYHDEH